MQYLFAISVPDAVGDPVGCIAIAAVPDELYTAYVKVATFMCYVHWLILSSELCCIDVSDHLRAPLGDISFLIVLILTRASAILGDAIVIGVTWFKTFRGWRAAVDANMRVSLSEMVLRDGEQKICCARMPSFC